jgi:hypothetical protein
MTPDAIGTIMSKRKTHRNSAKRNATAGSVAKTKGIM